jgi:hypothetical protein
MNIRQALDSSTLRNSHLQYVKYSSACSKERKHILRQHSPRQWRHLTKAIENQSVKEWDTKAASTAVPSSTRQGQKEIWERRWEAVMNHKRLYHTSGMNNGLDAPGPTMVEFGASRRCVSLVLNARSLFRRTVRWPASTRGLPGYLRWYPHIVSGGEEEA